MSSSKSVWMYTIVALAGLPLSASAQVLGAGPDAPSKAEFQAYPVDGASQTARASDEQTWLTEKAAAREGAIAKTLTKGVGFAADATPNFHYVLGHKVPHALDTRRIGVRIGESIGGDKIAVAVNAASLAGLRPAADGHRVINDFVLIALEADLGNEAGAYGAIERLAKTPGVVFATPIFHNAFIDGGYYMPTQRVMIRVQEGMNAQDVVRGAAADFEVANAELGHMPGAMTLLSPSHNGFDVLRRANELAVDPAMAWSTPAALESLDLSFVNPTDTDFWVQWAHRNTGQMWNGAPDGVVDMDMDTDEAWDIEAGNTSVEVLILDTGIETTHPDLHWINGRNFTTGAVGGVGNGAPGNSCDNHGTAVAGCAAEAGGTLGGRGTAPSCEVMSGKIGIQETSPCTSRFSDYSSEWLVNALDWGRDQGCEISNASIGVGVDSAVQDMYTSTWNSGVLHFASAGNGGDDSIGDNGSGFPGSASWVISVSALDPDGTLTSFSNYGTGCDLCAPGIAVYTTDRSDSAGYSGNDYTYFAGTSAASPCAAGVGALMAAQFPFATPSQLRTAIFNSCRDLGTAGIDTFYNRGFINAFNALRENAPSNDTCSSPIVIDSNFYANNQDVTWATDSRLEPDETCASVSRTVFYRFTAPNTGIFSIDTFGSSYDTVLSVFSGCPTIVNGQPTSLPVQLGCNDDAGGTVRSQISNLPLIAGQTVTIKVGAFGSASGTLSLIFTASFTPTPPDNDGCSAATEITDPSTGAFSYNPPLLDTDFATNATCEAEESCGSATNSNSVWYRFVPEHDGFIDVNTAGTDYDTVLSIHSGCSTAFLGGCNQPRHYACNDDFAGQLTSAINDFAVNGGSTYLIKVGDFGTEGGGLLNFNFSYTPDVPDNDGCNSATVIPAVAFEAVQDVFYATRSACENTEACDGAAANNYSVWYRYVAPQSGTVTIDTVGSNYDTVLAVFGGCAFPFLNGTCMTSAALACNDDAVGLQSRISAFPVTAGDDYLFKVSSFATTLTTTTTLDFNFQFTPDCLADFNGDGGVDGDDVIAFFAAWDNGDIAADVNGDEGVDGDDVIQFFSHWDNNC